MYVHNTVYCQEGEEVAFSAGLTHDQTILHAERVVYDRIFTNIGAGYDSSTGDFNCPTSGIYVFQVGTRNSLILISIYSTDWWVLALEPDIAREHWPDTLEYITLTNVLQNRCYMCFQWHVCCIHVITRQYIPPISKISRPCDEFTCSFRLYV